MNFWWASWTRSAWNSSMRIFLTRKVRHIGTRVEVLYVQAWKLDRCSHGCSGKKTPNSRTVKTCTFCSDYWRGYFVLIHYPCERQTGEKYIYLLIIFCANSKSSNEINRWYKVLQNLHNHMFIQEPPHDPSKITGKIISYFLLYLYLLYSFSYYFPIPSTCLSWHLFFPCPSSLSFTYYSASLTTLLISYLSYCHFSPHVLVMVEVWVFSVS
jgi:hypothetical protein